MVFPHNQAEEAWERLEDVTSAEFVQRAHPPRATVDADAARDRWMQWSKLCVCDGADAPQDARIFACSCPEALPPA